MPTYDPENTATAVFAGPGVIDFPFKADGDNATKLVTQEFYQLAGSYVPPTMSSAYSASANFGGSPPIIGDAYCVGDTEPRLVEAGLVQFSRSWANIPAARVVPVGTYSYSFPGLPTGTVGSPVTITDLSPDTGTDDYIATPTFTASSHGFAVGDRLLLALTFTGTSCTVSARIVSKTTNTFTTTGILVIFGGSPGTFSSGTATQIAAGREPDVIPADCVEAYSYALPGVTAGIATAADFQADPLFKPLAADGTQVDTLAVDTIPTAASYRASIASGEYLAVESGIRRWKGLILERRTLLVRYS